MRVPAIAAAVLLGLTTLPADAETRIRSMPPDGGVLAAGQRVDIRVEATADSSEPPRGLKVRINGVDITTKNVLAPGAGGERGAGGTGTDSTVAAGQVATPAPKNTTNFLWRGY